MREQLENIKKLASDDIQSSRSDAELDAVRVKYLGKKGLLTGILRGMGQISPEERPVIGALANTVREELEKYIEEKSLFLREKELSEKLENEKLDVTLPAKKKNIGKLHPISLVENRMREIFIGMGFEVVEGPEVESAYNNFDALNAPADHPSRDYTDTFYISTDILLRTQTSPVQIRAMQKKKPPI
ncbi:MAG TPA: phenylalanine--tRNA ligase subunit alpha, partial [Clostridiales bacterium]|nr:phenylalanine--tRNA ligase subunit alpha [Clostridiales bacterium]